MKTLIFYILAAVTELGGCFAFWAWLRQGRSVLWLIPGIASLIVFAWALTRADVSHAGRTYAAYGGVYIIASLLWLWRVERVVPDRWDMLGGSICLLGAAVIVLGPRAVTP